MAFNFLERRTKKNTDVLDSNLNEKARRRTELVPAVRTGEFRPLSTLLNEPSAPNAPFHGPLMLLRGLALRVSGINGVERQRAGGSPQCFALPFREEVWSILVSYIPRACSCVCAYASAHGRRHGHGHRRTHTSTDTNTDTHARANTHAQTHAQAALTRLNAHTGTVK